MSQADHKSQKNYWEQAGRQGYYAGTYFAADSVADHITARFWSTAMCLANTIGMKPAFRVLDLGCGDGTFANKVLAQGFAAVRGVDFSEAGIGKARLDSSARHVTFDTMDLVAQDVRDLGRFDGVFMLGILHHVKSRTPAIMRAIREMTDRVVVLEPNGAHLVRKLLELTPSYRAAGEDSFRHGQLVDIFTAAGFRIAEHQRFNLFPNQMPAWAFRSLRWLEPWVERTPVIRGLCTLNAYGLT